VSLLWSAMFGPVQLRRCDESASACPYRAHSVGSNAADDLRLQCLVLENVDAAAGWLRAAVTSADDMTTLRHIVSEDLRMVAWLSDHQIVDLIAQGVARRNLCLLVSQRDARSTQIRQAAAPPSVATGFTPSQLFPAAVVLPETPPEMPEPPEDLEQALQAAALEEAARDGVPFCEVCEKARQQAAGANAA
jgi:hypothetical protein